LLLTWVCDIPAQLVGVDLTADKEAILTTEEILPEDKNPRILERCKECCSEDGR
jgi:hypothetical protein